jgi:hypothetical protein
MKRYRMWDVMRKISCLGGIVCERVAPPLRKVKLEVLRSRAFDHQLLERLASITARVPLAGKLLTPLKS